MKKLLILLFFSGLILISCDNGTKDPEAGTNVNSLPTNETGPIKNAAVGEKPKVNPFKGGKGETPQLERVQRILTTDFWIINAYVKTNAKANYENQGRWYQFNPDGTFIGGKFSEQTSEGAWRFGYAGDVGQIRLDAKNDANDGLWNVKISPGEDIMIWVGTQEFHTTGVQTRLENLIFIPKNRKELGLKE